MLESESLEIEQHCRQWQAICAVRSRLHLTTIHERPFPL